MNLLYVYADNPSELNCSKHNCMFPAAAVNKTGKHHADLISVPQFTQNSPEIQEMCNKADVIIIERNFFGDTLVLMEYWRVRNKTLIAIYDDAYDIILPDNPSYAFWKLDEIRGKINNAPVRITQELFNNKDNDEFWNGIPMEERQQLIQTISQSLQSKIPVKEFANKVPIPFLTQFKWGLQMCKAIQVPSRMLAKDWSKYNKTIHINNFLEIEKYVDAKPMYPHDDIILGWQGSLSHYASFKESGIMDAIESVVKKYDNVRLLFGGDPRVFNEINLPENKKMNHGYVQEEQWGNYLKTYDIALAPLATEYDRRRSWIKVLEYMALQIPWIASNFEPYVDFRKYGNIINNSKEEWEKSLSYMIENIEFFREKARGEPYTFALTQSFDNNIEKSIEIYQKIIEEPYTAKILK